MRFMFLAPLALLPATSAAEPPSETIPAEAMPVIDPARSADESCPPISRYHATRRGGRLAPRNLDQLPAADHYKAAYRRIDGCVAPIIVNFRAGGR